VTYRSSTLRLLDEACPRALDFAEANATRYTDVFGVGKAAHHILDAWGQGTRKAGSWLDPEIRHAISSAIERRLIDTGPTFDGHQEPPIQPGKVHEGANLARLWVEERPLSPDARYEVGHAFTRNWEPTSYDDPKARLKVVHDVVEWGWVYLEDDETEAYGVDSDDYKSAWGAGPSYWNNLQQRIQLVSIALNYAKPGKLDEHVEFVRVGIANLRTRKLHRRDPLWLYEDDFLTGDSGWESIRKLQGGISLAMNAADDMKAGGRRPARPGAGCRSCPYIHHCEEGQTVLKVVHGIKNATPEEIASAYAIADGVRQNLFWAARDACKHGDIELDGSSWVGRKAETVVEPAPDAAKQLWEAWKGEFAGPYAGKLVEVEGLFLGFLSAARLGKSQVDSVIKKVYGNARGKAGAEVYRKRGELEEKALQQVEKNRFGVWRLEGQDG